jgi:repressor LexA
MEYKKDKNGRSNKPNQKWQKSEPEKTDYYQNQAEAYDLIYNEAEQASWNFKRTSVVNGEYGFSFNRHTAKDSLSDFRVLGEAVSTATPLKSNQSTKTRRNRYNQSVMLVAGDEGPAPWDDITQITYLKLPISGEVAAGQYDVTVAYHEPGYGSDADFVLVNSEEVKVSRKTFALRVRGQSMIDNEIDDGDIIIVQAQDWADDGDFVVACLTDSTDPLGFVTLKRFYRNRFADRVLLQPANQQMGPIHVLPRRGDAANEDLDGVKIQGRVTAIIKTGWVK